MRYCSSAITSHPAAASRHAAIAPTPPTPRTTTRIDFPAETSISEIALDDVPGDGAQRLRFGVERGQRRDGRLDLGVRAAAGLIEAVETRVGRLVALLVAPNGLADQRLVAGHVEDVVRNLERQADMAAIGAERAELRLVRAREHCAGDHRSG